MTIDPLRAKSLQHNSVPAKKKSVRPSEIKWQFNYKDTKINKNPFVTPNNKSCINKRCHLENWGFFCIRYFSKTKHKPAKKITGQCFSTEMEVACENSANLEQETKTTKIVTYPLFPQASSICYIIWLQNFHQTQQAMNGLSLCLFLHPDPVSKNLLHSLKHSLVEQAKGFSWMPPFLYTLTQELFLCACILLTRNRFVHFYYVVIIYIFSLAL